MLWSPDLLTIRRSQAWKRAEDLRDEFMNMSNTLWDFLVPGPDFVTFLNLESENLSLKDCSHHVAHDLIM